MNRQPRSILLVLSIVGTVTFACGMLRADDKGAQQNAEQPVIGTWKLLSAKYGDEAVDNSKLGITLKHITPTSFLWLSYDPETKEISRSSGGTYTLQGDRYEETPQYGLGADAAATRGKVQSFTLKIEGDKWHQVGTLSNGVKIDEVWERCKKE
jgi:hypothetical protein